MKIAAANSVVRSASRDVIHRPAVMAEVSCRCGNYYVMDSCPQQVHYRQSSFSSCQMEFIGLRSVSVACNFYVSFNKHELYDS